MSKQTRRIDRALVESNKIFLSWSGERSRRAAEALRDWLPAVLQAAKPWMSDSDIEKGTRGLDEVAKALGTKVGIIFLTPENLKADWILYEAGAYQKPLTTRRGYARTCSQAFVLRI